MGDAELRF